MPVFPGESCAPADHVDARGKKTPPPGGYPGFPFFSKKVHRLKVPAVATDGTPASRIERLLVDENLFSSCWRGNHQIPEHDRGTILPPELEHGIPDFGCLIPGNALVAVILAVRCPGVKGTLLPAPPVRRVCAQRVCGEPFFYLTEIPVIQSGVLIFVERAHRQSPF